MIELRPCPFCGGRAELNEHTGYGWRTVQCVECCASTSEAGVYTAAEAAARWNRRAADQPDAIPCPHPDIAIIDGVCYCCGKPVASTPTPQPAAAPDFKAWREAEVEALRGLLREAVSHVNTHAFSSADRLAERIDAALSAADQPAAVRVCDTCGNPVEVMPFKTHAPHHEPMQHVLCDVCKTAITERRRADQPSAAHLSNIVDKPADQPAAVRDPEAVEIVRCPRCHALPRPSLMGGCVCPNCGTTVLQPVPESAADNSPGITSQENEGHHEI